MDSPDSAFASASGFDAHWRRQDTRNSFGNRVHRYLTPESCIIPDIDYRRHYDRTNRSRFGRRFPSAEV